MKLLILSFVATLLVAYSSQASVIEERHAQAWAAYKNGHGKDYSDPAEEAARLANFIDTKNKIDDHNSNSNSTYTMGLNPFSDWHPEEKAALTGTILPPGLAAVRSIETFDDAGIERAATFDLRTAFPKCVGAIKDQARCGSCWAFSATASAESAYCMAHGGASAVVLSEQQLVSCVTTRYNGYGCDGGWPQSAWAFIVAYKEGYESAAGYPYTSGSGVSGTCQYTKHTNQILANLTSSGISIGSSVAAIQAALQKYGTLSVAIYANGNFQRYKSGVYDDSTCNGKGINHAVNIVGWGTNYWIVRNSWGTGWGLSGYIWMKSGSNLCMIESYVYAVTAK